jgi:SHS2 domain-containing protein
MGHRFLDHTADLAVELTAPTLPALFESALAAFAEALTEPGLVAEREERRFELSSSAADLLLVDWLGELLYAFETDDLLFRSAEIAIQESEDGSLLLTAEARGEPRDERHPIKVLIKAVTYHGLEVARTEDGGFRARVVFDI